MELLNVIQKVEYIKDFIKECPELFHDGINEDIIDLLQDIQTYIRKTMQKNGLIK